jgi:8-oxo-dGTP diphosphatase
LEPLLGAPVTGFAILLGMDSNLIPECFYRISIKALILNETRDKFLVTLEENGWWELPGGGLDWGMTPQEDLPREISEEMGVKTVWVADNPSYFLTDKKENDERWFANLLYEAKLESLDFTPSDECIDIKFVDKADIAEMKVFSNVKKLADMFNPDQH